jgi:GcrA cell cycle regulator
MDWTEARVEAMRRLWKAGLSAGQIAAELGGVSRNAVLGKLNRLKLLGSRLPASPPMRAPKAVRPPQAPLQVVGERGLPSPLREPPVCPELPIYPELDVPESAFAPLPGAPARPWLMREEGECAFPAGGDGAGLRACCAPVQPRSAYCPAHHARVYRHEPPSARREVEKLWAEIARRCAA